MHVLRESQGGEKVRYPVGIAPVAHEVDVTVVALAELEALAVETHCQSAHQTQSDPLVAAGVDDALGLQDQVLTGGAYEFGGSGRDG